MPWDPEKHGTRNLSGYFPQRTPEGHETRAVRIVATPDVLDAFQNLTPIQRGLLVKLALQEDHA